MSRLTYEEHILLDNLIYLELNPSENKKIIDIVYNLMNNGYFDYFMNKVGDCLIRMPKSEWINLLKQILSKPNLRELRITNTNTYYNSGMKYACFVDEEDNATVVFRGTVTSDEWVDNGKSAYDVETTEQIDALNYINTLRYNNITVTGHSKGGNKAQFVTILSPKVSNCISVNGQGFSNEFINRYSNEINSNKSKIVSINAKYDYVSCLFNRISDKIHYIKTDIQLNPFDYHKISILLDRNGRLRAETNEAEFTKIINDFSNKIISDLPEDMSKLIINEVINIVELITCKEKDDKNLLKVVGEYLLMFCYENYLEYQEVFNIGYTLMEALILPMYFWNDLIYAQETQSKDSLNDIIRRMDTLGSSVIKKLEISNKNQINVTNSLSNSINNLIDRLKNESLKS
ncbi:MULTISPECIES: Mbeg1-like protein [unclassified Clostridium]|uniref:Mbeg1-like protein n=1 Tax=unclassified Clostridium TaxID=2614128 RepID=UPI0002985911|nr:MULTISPECIES: Mbeg1-like protein [unclassified Clostridium]EKQ56691.1 MAG: Protein of unknown function (DUF2974) [Clostridium sp. Maddingley MBC34-26]